MSKKMNEIDRRQCLRVLAGAAAAAFAGCGRSGDYTPEDAVSLDRQIEAEAAASGQGPYGPLTVQGYRGLASLPYFEVNSDGLLQLKVTGLPRFVDFHVHLGMNFLFAPDIDLMRRTPRIEYMLDCDRHDPGCRLDLDVYINSAFTPEMHDDLEREARGQILFGSNAAATHTIPNLLAEMDAIGCERVNILPIAVGLPFGDDLTERWLAAIRAAHAGNRLTPFASVHPSDGRWRERLRAAAAQGVQGLKVHPEMQRVFPDDPDMMPIYAECERLGLVVIFHGGRSGIEPTFMRKYALIRRYVGAVRAFPRVQFVMGHAGARDVADAMELSRTYPNVWLEITGQGVTQLDRIIAQVGTERLLFGSDWPFYPLAATLAKVLIVTEKRPEARRAILRANADRVFALSAATRA
ncbi:amidohydrolase family protein [Candidatus Binatia bacterium]|nr:amidohydrolase family protein [Candidatus Binatia bacterium]